MTTPVLGSTAHADLHSDRGALRDERAERDPNPVVKVDDLAWLEFVKPDLEQAERFAHDFGFVTTARTANELHLRGTRAGTACMVIRRGDRSRFLGPAFRVADPADVQRLAEANGVAVARVDGPAQGHGEGLSVTLMDPSGLPVRVVAGVSEFPQLPGQDALIVNVGRDLTRVNAVQRPPRAPAGVERLGHLVLQTPLFQRSLDWYLHQFGLIVSDFLFFPGQRGRGPTMAFIRCDRGSVPADHHTLAIHLGPAREYVHSAYQVTDLDAVAAGGEYLKEQGYHRAWGIGRHIQGSQIFDYWRDPDRFMVEHFADGDMFDSTVEAGWAPMSASGLAQWGPPATKDFLGAKPSPRKVREVIEALRERDNEFDVRRLLGLLKVMSS